MNRDFAVYERRSMSWLDRGNTLRVRFATRVSALLLVGGVIMSGLVSGGYLGYEGSPWLQLPGKAAGVVGMAAQEITITGLDHHEPESLLLAMGVQPGGSLMGFDAVRARNTLQNLDWIESAKVPRLFPNQLVVEVREREPFAIWQRGTAYYVIDKSGAAMSGLEASQMVRSGPRRQPALDPLSRQRHHGAVAGKGLAAGNRHGGPVEQDPADFGARHPLAGPAAPGPGDGGSGGNCRQRHKGPRQEDGGRNQLMPAGQT